MKRSEKNSIFSSPPIKSSASPNGKIFFLSGKKVLDERNGSPGSNSTITHSSKSQKNSPNLDPKVTSKDHYDPVKNYLSPRPRFLRYNPDRRKEILLRLEMEEKGGDDSIFESESESASETVSSEEEEEFGDESGSLLEEEDEEFDTEREEEMEEEETWSFRGVLKYLLLLVVLLLSTQYISSMDSPVSAPEFEDPAACFQNHSLPITNGFEIGYEFLDGKQEQLGVLSFTKTMADEVIEVEMTENANMGHIVELEEIVEEESIAMVEAYKEEMKETEGGNEVEKAGKVKEDGEGETVIEDESVKIELQVIEETGEQIEEVVEDIEQHESQTDEGIEFLQVDHQTILLSEGTESFEGIKDVPMETSDTDMVQVLIMQIRSAVSMLEKWGNSFALKFQQVNPLKGFIQHMETSGTDMVQVLIMQIRSAVSMLEKWGNSFALKFQEVGFILHMETETFLKFVFSFLAFAAIVASSVFCSNIRRNGKGFTSKEKPSLVLPVERDEPKKLAISNTMPLTTPSVMESRAPSVELLAEFEIGGISSRSLKTSATNSRMKDEVSYSYFSEKDQLVYSEFSAMNSYSSASTAKKKLSGLSAVNSGSSERSTSTAKKKGLGKDLGSNDEVITPLRRSARIRNRADVISPSRH